jgi:hypothetical protein
MRFHHALLLAALAITPVCAKRIKVSDERGIVDSTLSAVGGMDCGGGGLRSSGGLGFNDVGLIAGDLGIAARRARRLFANGQSEDDDPWGGDRRAMGAVDALECGEGGGIAGTTRTTMTRK